MKRFFGFYKKMYKISTKKSKCFQITFFETTKVYKTVETKFWAKKTISEKVGQKTLKMANFRPKKVKI